MKEQENKNNNIVSNVIMRSRLEKEHESFRKQLLLIEKIIKHGKKIVAYEEMTLIKDQMARIDILVKISLSTFAIDSIDKPEQVINRLFGMVTTRVYYLRSLQTEFKKEFDKLSLMFNEDEKRENICDD